MTNDKDQKSGGVLKGLIKTGGDVMDKAIDKSGDIATTMMGQTAALISKLSDDIGSMADRILTMEERIGFMADRIVKTEELMARLTATLADREIALTDGEPAGPGPFRIPLLSLDSAEASSTSPPVLRISGAPTVYLLHVSTSPGFADGSTVISMVASSTELETAWQRSLRAIGEVRDHERDTAAGPVTVSVAVKTVGQDQEVSPLSNSVDLTIVD